LKPPEPEKQGEFVIEPGTRIPLSLINSVSTKGSAEGDRVYLETVFPILANGRIVIPPGSYVAGTITEVKRPGRVKGRGEMFLRFDSLTLPNGVTRDFRARVGSLDGQSSDELDRGEGKIKSDTNKSGDARSVGEAAAAGTSVGVIAGSVAGRPGMGAGVGAAAGAAAGLLGILLSRGPDVVLARGTTLEMVLDRMVSYSAEEIDFAGIQPRRPQPGPGAQPTSKGREAVPIPGRSVGRWPY
jgi:type IV secretion system protein VirB10